VWAELRHAQPQDNLRLMKDVIIGDMPESGEGGFCHFENYLARRAAMPISPQRRTRGDLAVRRTVRVDRR